MIKLKRVYEAPEKTDGWRVLVDRLWPRGLTKAAAKVDVWLKDVAPSDALRKWFHHEEPEWEEFERKYLKELAKKQEALEELRKMEKEHKTMTLLFGAKDETHNQAVVLLNVIKSKA